MRYLIENKMVVTANGVTTPGLESTEQELSTLPYRLLCFFIANNNRLVTREELFIQIWENHDLIPSGTALTTQISSLRKVMASYGIADDVLLTRPKQGFIFNASVEMLVDEEDISSVHLLGSRPHTRSWVIGFCVIICLGIIIYGLYIMFIESINIPWHQIGAVKSCTVYVPDDDMSTTVRAYYMRKAGEFLHENNIECSQHDRLLEYIQHPGFSEINDVYETKQYYAYCQWMKESYICNNTYYSAGKTN
ncbi:winged helix-turn-helix domain-containing protein [Enterobacter bugandensis]